MDIDGIIFIKKYVDTEPANLCFYSETMPPTRRRCRHLSSNLQCITTIFIFHLSNSFNDLSTFSRSQQFTQVRFLFIENKFYKYTNMNLLFDINIYGENIKEEETVLKYSQYDEHIDQKKPISHELIYVK